MLPLYSRKAPKIISEQDYFNLDQCALEPSSVIAEAVLFAVAVFYSDKRPSLIRAVSKSDFS